MSWHPGGEVRCASATYVGRFVVEGWPFCDELEPRMVTISGNARQRRKRVREIRRAGYLVTRGGVAS